MTRSYDHVRYVNRRIPRRCLKCDRKFLAANRFIRICDRCKRENEQLWMPEVQARVQYKD